jgi:WD40 repeat protein
VVRVIDLEKNLIQKSFIASKETIKEMLVTDELIIVAGCDPVIRGYSLIDGTVKNFTGHQGWVYCLYISKLDTNLLYSGGDDKCVRIWDIKTASCIEELRAHRNGVTSICICGNKLYTGSFDHYIVEYNYQELRERIVEK